MKVKHLKNIKPAITPVWFLTRKDYLSVYFIPRESTKYDLNSDIEQLDWNKSTGLSFSPLWDSHRNTMMLGWRYNLEKDVFEFTYYAHRNNKEVAKSDNLAIKAKVNEPVKMWIDKDRVHITNLITGDSLMTQIDNFRTSKWARSINPWFGGTLPPPSTVTYDLYWNITDTQLKELL